MKGSKFLFAVAGLVALPAVACTGFYVGKEVSKDGDVLLGRTVDHGAMATSFRQIVVPRVENAPGRVLKGTCGFEWPLPATTWKYVATPAITAEGIGDFSSAVANEKGLVMTATVTGHLGAKTWKAFKMAPHGCAEDNITPLVASSCANVQEALDLIGRVMAKNGTREPNIYMLADQKEAWLVETYITNLWAAMRMPADKVMAFGNHFILEGYDPKSPDWRAAPEIESAAKEKGLAVYTDDGKLHLYRTYDGARTFAPNIRTYHAHRLMAPGTEGEYHDLREMPNPFAPGRKLGPRDLMAFMRSHYEGTRWSQEEHGREDVRVIGDDSQATCHVISLRDDLPPERAATLWSCLGPSEFSLFIPLGNAITRTIPEFAADAEKFERRDAFYPDRFAGDAFYRLISLAQQNRELYGKGVRDYWARREDEFFAKWPKILASGDAAAMTAYVCSEQRRALDDVNRMAEEILYKMSKNSRVWRWMVNGASTHKKPRQPFESSDLRAARLAPHAGDPRVVVATNAPKTVKIASEEFAKYWKQVTDRALPTDDFAPKAEFTVDPSLDAAHDEYRIVSTKEGVRFVGANGRAVLYAVYDFFERQAGCRWFWDGDRVPKHETISLEGLDVREKARFEYRGLRYFAHRGLTRFQAEHWGPNEWKQELDWCLKRRLNVMMPRIGMDDTWQKAYPDIVPYPDPKAPIGDNLTGYDNRVSYWGLRYRGELRKIFTEYALDRGMIVPTDFGTMTHWYARTPVEFLDAKKPPFLPQANNNYKQRTGLVWDIFQGNWLDDYWHLTDTFVKSGYGTFDVLHTIGLGERMCFSDRAKNLQMKKDVLRKITDKALSHCPDSKIFLAGWDFYCMWKPEEVKELLPQLDPRNTIIWDYEADAATGNDGWSVDSDNNFTKWGVVGKFPYTFGIFLAYEQALDIRAHYGVIEAREKVVANDPMCKGYIFWPESSHTDTLLLRYFTANAWKPGQTHLEVLKAFCRDRYGDDAEKFEPIWRKTLPVSEMLGWNGNWGSDITWWDPKYLPNRSLEKDAELLDAVPEILGDLAAIEPKDDFQRRDVIDLARTVMDRALIGLRYRMVAAYDGWTEGKVSAREARRTVESWRKLVRAATELLALHADYSLCYTIERMNAASPGLAPNFDKVLLDNASNFYCRSHQYEVAAGWYLPLANDVADEMLRRIASGNRTKIEGEQLSKWVIGRRDELFRKGIEAYRPQLARTIREYRRILGDAREAAAR